MKYVGWMYNEDTGASGSAVEDDNGNTVAWFENADDAIAYAKMATDLADVTKRAEAAEAALAAVPRQSIDALFRQQFGTYPIWFNETWAPIADWLGYKSARV